MVCLYESKKRKLVLYREVHVVWFCTSLVNTVSITFRGFLFSIQVFNETCFLDRRVGETKKNRENMLKERGESSQRCIVLKRLL